LSARGAGTANYYRMANGELPETSRRLWQLAASETREWSALAHDRLRLARCLAGRGSHGRDFFAGVAGEWERLRIDFKVADLSLAEFGRKEIRLAEHEMPGLMACASEYAARSRSPARASPARCT
jgi:hypothetical protein